MRDKIHDHNEKNKPTNEPGETPKRSAEDTSNLSPEIKASGEAAPAITEEELTSKAFTALAYLRAKHGSERAESARMSALDKIEQALRRRVAQSDDDHALPASARRPADDSTVDDEPPTSRMTPPAQSRFALRDDGVLLLSLEDADDRDLDGRTIIPFMVITADEGERAREVLDFALSDAAAQVIGALPMKVST